MICASVRPGLLLLGYGEVLRLVYPLFSAALASAASKNEFGFAMFSCMDVLVRSVDRADVCCECPDYDLVNRGLCNGCWWSSGLRRLESE
jgi:hypothetical protein